MKKTSLFAALLALGCVAFPHRSPAPLTIRQGEGATYTAPGAEEVPNERDAQTQFDKALAAEKAGKDGTAVGGYRKTVKRFPKSQVAASAQFRIGQILERHKDYNAAAVAYERTIIDYPHSADFNAALEGEFNLGTAYLEGARQKVLGVPTLPSRDRSIAIYKVITYNAPYSRLAPLAQFNIGQAYSLQGNYKDAVAAYQTVVDKYPNDPIASDALYQIAFSYMQVTRDGSNDRNSVQRAQEGFEDFLAAYPNSEKAPQAKENIAKLSTRETGGSLQIADYYYGQKLFRAAVVYYNDVIRQEPNSPNSERAKGRLDTIRKKYGEKYFVTAAPASPGKPGTTANGVTPKLGDTRLQAQSDTSKRPDYAGPPVSAPTPPPPPASANPGFLPGGPGPGQEPVPPPSQPAAPRPDATPLPVPEGEQPALPSQ